MRRGITACLIFLLMFPVVLRASPSAAEKVPVTREYFENPDTESGSDAGRAAEAESIDMEEAAADTGSGTVVQAAKLIVSVTVSITFTAE